MKKLRPVVGVTDLAALKRLLVLGALWLVPVAVGAQAEPDPPAEETGAEETEASEPPEADPNEEEARRRFLQGTALMSSGDYAGAAAELEESYRLLPRSSTLFNIAQCQERLFRYDLAMRAYERYLAEAGPDAEDRATVERTVRTLRNVLGTLHVSSNVPAEIWVGERLVGESPGEVLVPSGEHLVELRAEGYLPARSQVQIVGGGEAELELTLEQPEQITIEHTTVEESGPGPWLFVTGVGLTLAATGVGAGFGVAAILARDEISGLQDIDRLYTAPDAQIDNMKSLALNADILYLAAGVVGIATVVIAFLTDWDGASSTAEDEATVRLTPWLDATGVGLSVGGPL